MEETRMMEQAIPESINLFEKEIMAWESATNDFEAARALASLNERPTTQMMSEVFENLKSANIESTVILSNLDKSDSFCDLPPKPVTLALNSADNNNDSEVWLEETLAITAAGHDYHSHYSNQRIDL
ncbi:hypothetical protein BCR33DRAFT_239564 [Rhizoclosmatium globosum]|uniref:Uncharacterized protein n=1 Tax=Rhizoclosmatium globosum TaxID=329046 RepID=A0A1Y2AF70_9FUNG|nr:hypothetical protein BCR33DRAFT_239564 [Rhizoclosmatium globosum]|eukprot:ORY20605.1 hypothetical protein BCR33DRAFT_239564 [Rhizoclosmatium globosum]